MAFNFSGHGAVNPSVNRSVDTSVKDSVKNTVKYSGDSSSLGTNLGWQRLKKRADFQKIQKKGQAAKMPALVLLYAPAVFPTTSPSNLQQPNNRLPNNRLGFTATKRSVGNAVARNRAKRRMRGLATAVLERAQPPEHKPVDVVLIARGYILTRNFKEMAQELEYTLKKEGFTFAEKPQL